MKKKKPLLIGLICGAIIALLSWFYLTSLEEKYRQATKLVPVLTAKGYTPQGTVIKPAMVQVNKVPQEYLQPGVLSSVRDLVNEEGKSIYVTVLPILESEQISSSKLITIGKEMGLATVIPEGKIAFSVILDEANNLGGLLRPGNKVNVLGTFDYEEKDKTCSATTMLLQNVNVLSIGKKIVGTPPVLSKDFGKLTPEELKEEKTVETENESTSVVTLALTSQEATMLTFAREKGKLSLVLRATGDETIHETIPVGYSAILPGSDKIFSPAGKKGKEFFIDFDAYLKQLQKISK